jgi:hypothetical protein
MSTKAKILAAFDRYATLARQAGLVAPDDEIELRAGSAWYVVVVSGGHRQRPPGLSHTGFIGRTKAHALSTLEAAVRAWSDILDAEACTVPTDGP